MAQQLCRKLELPDSALAKARSRGVLTLAKSLRLEVDVQRKTAEWRLMNSKGLWGWGELVPGQGRWVTQEAEIVDELRGLRIYPTVLKHLRELLGPIRSDAILSRSAAAAWEKTPARLVRTKRRQYYLWNPRSNPPKGWEL